MDMKIKNLKRKIKDFTSSLSSFEVVVITEKINFIRENDSVLFKAKGKIERGSKITVGDKTFEVEDMYMINVKGKKAIHLILKEV